MASGNWDYHVIEDETIYNLRELIPVNVRLLPGNDVKDPSFGSLDGRHNFWMHPTSLVRTAANSFDPEKETDSRIYATLRIDKSNGVISGDLFQDMRRRKWLCSWHSEAVFSSTGWSRNRTTRAELNNWDYLAIADVFNSGSKTLKIGDPEKMAILIKHDSQCRLQGVRISGIRSDGERVLDFSMTEKEPRRKYKTFRHLKIINVLDKDISPDNEGDHIYKKVVRLAIGDKGEHIQKKLLDTGARIYWEDGRSMGGAFTPFVERGDTPFEKLWPFQWTDDPYSYAILLCSEDAPNKRLFGTTLGLDGNQLLHKARFGAVVFVRNIVDAYQRQFKIDDEDMNSHIDELVQRVQHTYIHELGHLLNLPHPWQRDRFRTPRLDANPAAESWMNYGSRYPLGDFMVTSRKYAVQKQELESKKREEEEEFKLAIEDSEASQVSTPRFQKFTDVESKWLWHAPFDQIASGGEYYTQGLQAPPRLSRQSKRERLKLEIWDAEKGEDGVHIFRKSPSDLFSFQPIFGEVKFDTDNDYINRHPFLMAFQSPMLSLLVRADDPYRKEPDLVRSPRMVPVAPFPNGWADSVNTTDRLSIADILRLNGPRDTHKRKKKPFELERKIPLVTPLFLRQFEGDWNEYFTLQAVLRPLGTGAIFSNKVRVRFKPGRGTYTKREEKILLDPNFRLLLELLGHLPGKDIRALCPPSRHTDGYDDPAFEKLAFNIDERENDKERSNLSNELFDHCKKNLKSA